MSKSNHLPASQELGEEAEWGRVYDNAQGQPIQGRNLGAGY